MLLPRRPHHQTSGPDTARSDQAPFRPGRDLRHGVRRQDGPEPGR